MYLTVDIGNSRVKYGLYSGQCLLQVSYRNTGKVSERITLPRGGRKITKIGLASVVPQATRKVLQQLSTFPVQVIKPEDCLVPLLVSNPEKVGVDRVLNVKAAYSEAGKECLVVDIGTAVTVDVCSRKGEFIGGVILPGPSLWLKSLTSTALLPPVRIQTRVKLPGKDTVQAIRAGLTYGLAGAIEKVVLSLLKKFSGSTVFLTGGGAVLFQSCLSFPYVYRPHLSLEGIRQVLEETESRYGKSFRRL